MGIVEGLTDSPEDRTAFGERLNEFSSAVIGAAIEVHRQLGPGFPESVYEKALCLELELRQIPFAHQPEIKVSYKGRVVGEGRLDLLVNGMIIVELKAVEAIAPVHVSQVLSYLKATGYPLGLLINFNVKVLKQGITRLVL